MAAKFSKLFAATCLAGLGTPQIVSAEISIFELRITNNTDRDLTFKLKADHSKKVDLTYDKNTSRNTRSRLEPLRSSGSSQMAINVLRPAGFARLLMAKSTPATKTMTVRSNETTIIKRQSNSLNIAGSPLVSR
jgi:hypothetical protein